MTVDGPSADAMRAATSPTLALTGHVRCISTLGRTLRRITLGGADLAHLGVDGPTWDLRLRLVFPSGGSTSQSVMECLADMRPEARSGEDSFSWYPTWLSEPESRRGVMRTYTARTLRHSGGQSELDVDFALHENAVSGPASRWASHARVGDVLTVVGPNRALTGPDRGSFQWRPGTARHVLLAADETAVPAALAILEALAGGPGAEQWSGDALLEVPYAADAMTVIAPPGINIRWLPRSGAARGTLVAAAVREAAPGTGTPPNLVIEDSDVDLALQWETSGVDPSERYAWVAGEAGTLRPLRRWLLGPAGMTRNQVAIMGYWREGRVGP